MPNEADGVRIDDLGTVGSTGPAELGVSGLLARIAAHVRAAQHQTTCDGTRQAPMPVGVLYENVDHPSLKAMVTEGVDPAQVGTIASNWQQAGSRLTQFQDDVTGAINTSRAEWQGDAGEAARQFMADVGRWIGDAGRGAKLAGDQAAKQSEALAAAKNAMPEPVAFDVDAANAELRQITDPVQLISRYAEHMKAYAAQQAAQRRAAEVVTAYDAALAESGTMPAFSPPPAMAGSENVRTNVPPMPRSSTDAPAGSTSPQSASGTAPMSVTSKTSESTPASADTPPQAAAAVPFAGGFAAAPLMNGNTERTIEPAVPGGAAAADYMVEGDFGSQRTAPPVIGG
ncbi:hypothetical protein JOF56_002555 [Kibdelosporangium banguiense]|uniref:PPE domain-containing protein n=1 Tax=Kibdelosporangium banguiense TaxID=1365924 RepID=A0ABS4TCL2_9PSEU|nr:hypothetical protein [Kibdelosporangium banguiense]MBP2322170.1 hypothetical protein [Kibdelosporangium banguiense]